MSTVPLPTDRAHAHLCNVATRTHHSEFTGARCLSHLEVLRCHALGRSCFAQSTRKESEDQHRSTPCHNDWATACLDVPQRTSSLVACHCRKSNAATGSTLNFGTCSVGGSRLELATIDATSLRKSCNETKQHVGCGSIRAQVKDLTTTLVHIRVPMPINDQTQLEIPNTSTHFRYGYPPQQTTPFHLLTTHIKPQDL